MGLGDGHIEALFTEHYRFVRAVAYKFVGELGVAEDVAQDVFIVLGRELERRPRFIDSLGSTRAYLARCTRNAALNALRAEGRRGAMHDRVLSEVSGSVGMSPPVEEEVIRREDAERVRAALASLPERERSLLILRHSGLSYKELSEAVGVRESSVGKQLERAHQRFARAYGEGSGGSR